MLGPNREAHPAYLRDLRSYRRYRQGGRRPRDRKVVLWFQLRERKLPCSGNRFPFVHLRELENLLFARTLFFLPFEIFDFCGHKIVRARLFSDSDLFLESEKSDPEPLLEGGRDGAS